MLVVGAIQRQQWEPLRGHVTAILHRPISVGEVVDAVRQTLPLEAAFGPARE